MIQKRTNRATLNFLILAAFLAFGASSLGCGGTDTENRPVISPGGDSDDDGDNDGLAGDSDADNNGDANGDGTAGDADSDGESDGDGNGNGGDGDDDLPGDGDDGEGTDDGDGDAPFGPGPACAGTAYGPASDGIQLTHSTNFWDLDQEFPFNSGCTFSGTGRYDILQFSLADVGGIVATVSDGRTAGLELRTSGSCAGTLPVACGEKSLTVQGLSANRTYYLVIHEVVDDPGDMGVQIEVSHDPACPERGVVECHPDEPGVIRECRETFTSPDIPRWVESSCPQGCSDARCDGDSCDQPLVLSASATLPVNWGALEDENNNENELCVPPGEESPDPDEPPDDRFELPSADLIVLLEDLEAGQEVMISLLNFPPVMLGDAIILIREDCTNSMSCTASWRGEDSVTFVAPADGDYYLILDSLSGLGGSTEVSIDFL